MAIFTELVDDVILRIIDCLETERDLNSVCLVARRHRHLVQQQLYRRHVRFHGSWALTWAAQHDRVDTARHLLAAGADVYARTADEARLPPIVVAAQFGSVAVTKLLFETPGVDPEWTDGETSQPLAWAAEAGHEDMLKLYLQDPRVDPNRGDPDQRTALTYAAEAGQIKIVELLLKETRVDPTTCDTEGRQALAWAAKCNKDNTSVLEALLADQRVDPKHFDNKQRTALHLAATVGIVPNLQLLAADLNQGDEDGAIPISFGAGNGCLDAVKAFLADPRVHPNRKDGRGVTPLMYAAITDHPAVVECFLSDDSVRVNEVAVGRTALIYAAKPIVIKWGIPAESLPRSLLRSFPSSPLITSNLDFLNKYKPPDQYQYLRISDVKPPVDSFLIGVTPRDTDHWFVVASKPEEKAGIIVVDDKT
ncbi:hypothetical protein K4F52_001870 [Lecanicillium sp. MT-2017a]|nr:hypothetical protein K4F52_001870 [Lecanicillium sp. MT-2017a]